MTRVFEHDDVDFFIKQHDQLPPLRSTLEDADGPVALDGDPAPAVRFLMRRAFDGEPVLAGDGAIDPDGGVGAVVYNWQAGDTDSDGDYVAEWEVMLATDKPSTFPTDDYIRIRIARDLG